MTGNLNEVILSPTLLAELYNNVLIDSGVPGQSQEIEQPKPEPDRKWLGDNRKNILVLVQAKAPGLLSGADLDFLKGILGACKLDPDDVAIASLADFPGSDYKKLIETFRSKIILLFGAGPAEIDLPVIFPEFQVQSHAKTKFLSAPSLQKLSADQLLKSKLWVCLRQVFGV